MREILFRVWDAKVKRMSEPFSLGSQAMFWTDGDVPMPIPMIVRTERFLIMQFTGLVDKNGRKIFEGDVVKVVRYDQKTTSVWKVLWDEWCWAKRKSDSGPFAFDAFESRRAEVIGNIHENPELLEKKL